MEKNKNLAYSINPSATLNQDCLVLDLIEVVKEGYQFQCSIPTKHSLSQWRSLLISQDDKEAFQFFLKEELLFQQRKTGKTPHAESMCFQQVHISPAQVQMAFQFLSKTGKLFCEGKPLSIDFYGKTEFYYEATLLNQGQIEIQGRLKWRDTDIDLKECHAMGPGKPHHWFVRGIALKMIQTDIPWKKLQILAHDPLILEGGLKQEFLDQIDESDRESPQLVIKNGSLNEIAESTAPYPILQLTDRWGTCADLWMDYGHGHLVPFHDQRPVIKDQLGKTILKRQMNAETNWEKDLLETDYLKKPLETSRYYCPMNKIAKSLSFLLEIGWKILDWQKKQVVQQKEFDLTIDDQGKALIIKGRLVYENYEADLTKVLGAFNRKEHFIQLSSSTVGLLPQDSSQEILGDLSSEGEVISDGIKMNKNRFGTLESLWNYARPSPSLEELKNRRQDFKGIQEALPTPAFQGTLRPYQQLGVNWMSFLYDYGFHGILADEMGLGKTVQVLAFLSRLPQRGPHLIVMPTSLLFNWRKEIERFLPDWSCCMHQGPQRSKRSDELKKADVILTSYTTLRLDFALFHSISFVCLILDEAQMIKNAQTQTAQAVCRLDAQLKLSLTGTPVENRLLELWSHFHFLMPDLLGTQDNFEADVQASQSDRRYLERIKRKTGPFLLRRRKQDVARDLPERLDQVVWIEMGEEERKVYDQLLAGFKSGLLKKVKSEGLRKHRMDVLEAILRLRQVCCHPLLVSSLLEASEHSCASAKFDSLMEDLETIVQEEHKVLVYSQFTSMLHLMTKAAKERGWNFSYLDGSTKNREEVVTRFQEDDSQSIFFISLKAGGVGLNLTSADYVYLYDPWWNEAVEEQAINRAHRIGRKDRVIAKRFVVAETIEEKMMRLKATKRLIVEDIFSDESTDHLFTIEDLEFLLS